MTVSFISTEFSAAIEPDLLPYFMLVTILACALCGQHMINNHQGRLSATALRLSDLGKLSPLLGLLGFSAVAWGLALAMVAGTVAKPVVIWELGLVKDFLLCRILFNDVLKTPATVFYTEGIHYWTAIVSTYGVLIGVGLICRNGALNFLYKTVRFFVLIFFCVVSAYLIEQAFEFALDHWAVYALFGRYITRFANILSYVFLLVGVLFAVVYARDKMPFWAVVMNFNLWLLQMVFLASVLILVGGLLGSIANGLYGLLATTANLEIIQAIGVYLGLLVGSGYWILKVVQAGPGMVVLPIQKVIYCRC